MEGCELQQGSGWPRPVRPGAVLSRPQLRQGSCTNTATHAPSHAQVYTAAGDRLVTGPVSLAGATGLGASGNPFSKVVPMAFGEYTVRGAAPGAPWHQQSVAWWGSAPSKQSDPGCLPQPRQWQRPPTSASAWQTHYTSPALPLSCPNRSCPPGVHLWTQCEWRRRGVCQVRRHQSWCVCRRVARAGWGW